MIKLTFRCDGVGLSTLAKEGEGASEGEGGGRGGGEGASEGEGGGTGTLRVARTMLFEGAEFVHEHCEDQVNEPMVRAEVSMII